MRIVLDTNVLVSGIFFGGMPGRILKAWRDKRLQLVVSPEIFGEYQRVAVQLAEHHPGVDISRVLSMILQYAEMVQEAEFIDAICEDPDDDKFLACAKNNEVAAIVSGDRHLLDVERYCGIPILTPRLFVESFLGDD